MQQKRRPVTIHSQNSVTRTRKIYRKGTPRKSRQNNRELFCITRCYNHKEIQVAVNSTGFKKTTKLVSKEKQQCQIMKKYSVKSQPKSRRMQEKYGCLNAIWTMHTDNLSYLRNPRDTMYSQKSGEISPTLLFFGLRRASTDCVISPPFSKNILIKCWNSKRQFGSTTYRASETKTELFKRESTWLGYYINQDGVKPIMDKYEDITKLEAPKNAKEFKSFLCLIQRLSKLINNLSKETDKMRTLLKKDTNWESTLKKYNYITTDACNTGLGASLWQKEGEVFRPITFASRFLTDCENNYALNELELLRALWGLE